MMQALAGRAPTAAEMKILVSGFEKRRSKYEKDVASAEKLLKFGDLPLEAKVPKPELAAYTLVASTILNLDEVVTKE